MAAMSCTATWMGDTALFNSQLSAVICHEAYLQAILGREYNTHVRKFLHSFSYLLLPPGNLYWLTDTTPHGGGRLTGSRLAFVLRLVLLL